MIFFLIIHTTSGILCSILDTMRKIEKLKISNAQWSDWEKFENLARGIHGSCQIFERQLVRKILWGFEELGLINGSCENGIVCGGWLSVSEGSCASWDGYPYAYRVFLAHGPVWRGKTHSLHFFFISK